MYRGRIKRVHFVGIGGSGMSGIAEVLFNMGYVVTGSDLKNTGVTARLKTLGITCYAGHKGENVVGSDCVVYSSAVKPSNPELIEANSRQIPIIPRAEMLAELMRMKYGIAVAGTHGKTTTTSMIAAILAHAGIDPTIVTGGKLNSLGANAKLGAGDFLVAEADESDGSFLKLSPTIAVVTNIDREHMDHYSGMEEVKKAYLDFMNKVPFYGCAIVCLDHPVIQELVPKIERRCITYAISTQGVEADVYALDMVQKECKTSFKVVERSTEVECRMEINLPGVHNVANALSAFAVARELGINTELIKEGLKEFKGVERRFQIKGVFRGITVVDDYGHHPVEIKAVLKAIRDGFRNRIVVVFQPHRYSRTKDLFKEFLTAFNDADVLILTDVYGAGEEKIPGAAAQDLYNAIKAHGHGNVHYVPEIKDAPDYIAKIVKPADMVITLGAGDVWKVGEKFIENLKERGTRPILTDGCPESGSHGRAV